MHNTTIDFESYYDRNLSVKQQGALNYLTETDSYLVAIVSDDDEWVGNPLEADWSRFKGARVWAHNMSFDGAYFLAHDLQLPGVQQDCSANLAAWLGAPRSLDKAAAALLPNNSPVSKDVRDALRGRHWRDLSEEEQEVVRAYNLNDARTAHQIVARFAAGWPSDEVELSRHTCAMGWHGIGIDRPKLHRYLARLSEIQATALKQIPWVPGAANLSLIQARAHCVKVGVEPPSSFDAKSESYLRWELQHGLRVPWIADMRRYRRATLLQARLEAMDRRIWPATGRLTYSLKYFGSHTGRWSGGEGLNLQNLNKEEFHGVRLRSLLVPAPGTKLIVADLSQIEPRVLHWLCGDEAMLKLIQVGHYSFYEAQAKSWGLWEGSPGTLKKSDPALYLGIKSLSLGAGYGLGPMRFRGVVLVRMGQDMSLAEAKTRLLDYRRRNPLVMRYWQRLDRHLQSSIGGGEMSIGLPSGRELTYRRLRRIHGDVYATFATEAGYRERKLWGGSLTENVVQATARDVFARGLLRLIRAGLRVVLHAHDEVVLEVDPDVRREDVEGLLRQPPEWASDLPIDVESWEGATYAAHA
jgi:DNA polymerase bacteriophage-type